MPQNVVEVTTEVVMRVASLLRSLGFASLAAMLLLTSPGVRITEASEASSHGAGAEEFFSYDPALAPPPASPAAVQTERGATCAARDKAPVLPLRGMPLLMAERAGETDPSWKVNSLNARGYNIGGSEPAAELRKLEMEVMRRQGR